MTLFVIINSKSFPNIKKTYLLSLFYAPSTIKAKEIIVNKSVCLLGADGDYMERKWILTTYIYT